MRAKRATFDLVARRVRKTITEHSLVPRGACLVLAVSGGPDSVVMLHVLAAIAPDLDCSLIAASIDHGLRPGAARDVDVARAHAVSLRIPFVTRRVRVERRASIQAAARDARYAALRAIANERHATHLAVAHTEDDQAETVLLGLLRGSGLGALRGILPERADGVIRPMLEIGRDEVERVVAELGLEVARDPSNDDDRFLRVRVRKTLLPALAAERPNLRAHLARIAEDVRALVPPDRASRMEVVATDEVVALLALPARERRVALRALASLWGAPGAGREHVDALDALLAATATTARVRLPGDVEVSRSGARLVGSKIGVGARRRGAPRKPRPGRGV